MRVSTEELYQARLARLQSILVRVMPTMGVANFAMGTVTAVSYYGMASLNSVIWVSVIWAFSVLQITKGLQLRRRATPKKVSGRLMRKAEWTSLFLGLWWGAAPMFLHTSDPTADFLIYTILGGMCAGTTALVGPLFRINAAFLFGETLMLTIGLAFFPHELWLTILGTFGVLCLTMIHATRSTHDIMVSMIENALKHELSRAWLMEAIEATDDAFGLYGDDGCLVAANSTHIEMFGSDPEGAIAPNLHGSTISLAGRFFQRQIRTTKRGGTVVLHSDVTTVKESEIKARAAEREAEASVKVRERFVETLIHELLGPVETIRHLSRVFSNGSEIKYDSDQARNILTRISRTSGYLRQLVEEIIEFGQRTEAVESSSLINTAPLIEESVSLAVAMGADLEADAVEVSVSPQAERIDFNKSELRRLIIGYLCLMSRSARENFKLHIKAGAASGGKTVILLRATGTCVSDLADPTVVPLSDDGVWESTSDERAVADLQAAKKAVLEAGGEILVRKLTDESAVVAIVLNDGGENNEPGRQLSEEALEGHAAAQRVISEAYGEGYAQAS